LRRLAATLVALLVVLSSRGLEAQEARAPASTAGGRLENLIGRPLSRIEIRWRGDRWLEAVELTHVRPGQIFSPEVARVAMQELVGSGRFADVQAFAEAAGDGVVLVLSVLPRRIAARVNVRGSPIEGEDVEVASGLAQGRDVTSEELPIAAERVRELLRRRGYPEARVDVQADDTDDPVEVVIQVGIEAGAPLSIRERWFAVWPDPDAPGLRVVLGRYAVREGDPVDEIRLEAADRELVHLLVQRGYHQASVTHRVDRAGSNATLRVRVNAGPLVRLEFEGNRRFDASELTSALELEDSDERAPQVLVEALRRHYVQRGLFDAEITFEERDKPGGAERALVFKIREGKPLRVVGREYPCLGGGYAPADIGSEIDSFLSELPGGSTLIDAVDEEAVDSLFGPTAGVGRRRAPAPLAPWTAYVPDVYERAVEHLKDLFRSQGYLSASVGPPMLLRRACDRRSPAGQCIPVGPRKRPRTECRYDEIGVPLEEPSPDPALECKPDPLKGLSCEPEAVLHLPIKLGPRTFISEIVFEGNESFVGRDLRRASELEIGAPASQGDLDKARQRLLDAYAEQGFAFADVEASLDLSADHTRARARFVISERERVRVSRVDVVGARRTSEQLIRKRIALKAGDFYRRSQVRLTQERLATLGVFSSVSVSLEDPYVPAREKVVIVTVEERPPMRLDAHGGVSSGEGFRVGFEFGHNNVAGQALGVTLHVQLAYLPDALIFEPDVRAKYDNLDIVDRIERRNTLAIEFPEVGLGPLFRLAVEGVDLRDNARDYGLTKDAGIVSLMFQPDRRLSFQLGASLELNEATIFVTDEDEDEAKRDLSTYIQQAGKQNLFRVPEGQTIAVAPRVSVTWDRRDNPLDATSGTFVSAGIEYVCAFPVDSSFCPEPRARSTTNVFAPAESMFLRYTNRVAGYLRFNRKGLALAASFRWGAIQQLDQDSETYPDRLFFMGGVDTLRGFAQDALVPEDIAQELIDSQEDPNIPPDQRITIDQVLIRGGDLFINPRAELRVPLNDTVQTALFVDSGNLWTDPAEFDPLTLRYTVGTGLRVRTPVGPLVFDYGFNASRVLDAFFPSRDRRRYWEDIGAFHFSIGLF
jgi:outer membrane protein assembly factor BamA